MNLIIADIREQGSGVFESLKSLRIRVRVEQLSVGDYIVSARCAIERKTAPDFFSSLFGGRLFEQAQRLSQVYPVPVMIVEGDFQAEMEEHRNPKAALGALVSLAVTYGIRILQTTSTEQTAQAIALILKHEKIERADEVVIHLKPRIGSDATRQRYIAASLPRVGPVLADRLLHRFRTIRALSNASSAQLAALRGVPKNTASEIYRIMNLPYGVSEDSAQRKLPQAFEKP